MTRKIRHELVYPGATVAQVRELVVDAEFREAVCGYQRAIRKQATVTPGAGTTRVELDYAHGTERVPGFARKFVGDEIPIAQQETWTPEGTATFLVQIPGKPGDMKGTARIEQRGDDAVETVDLTVKVGLPLVGGKIEELIAGLMVKAFTAENKVGLRWLAGDREPLR